MTYGEVLNFRENAILNYLSDHAIYCKANNRYFCLELAHQPRYRYFKLLHIMNLLEKGLIDLNYLNDFYVFEMSRLNYE